MCLRPTLEFDRLIALLSEISCTLVASPRSHGPMAKLLDASLRVTFAAQPELNCQCYKGRSEAGLCKREQPFTKDKQYLLE